MTSKTIPITKTSGKLHRFPTFPPRDDMQNWKYLYRNAQATALAAHIGNQETTTVVSEAPVGQNPRDRVGIRIPDLTLSHNSHPEFIEEDGGYSIERQGKPPDFVLEIASPTTGRTDYTAKRRDYERFGIAEYWRFDSSGGEYHDAALAGDRLVDGSYQPIEIEWLDDSRCRGYSDVLGLYVCWEDGELRWFDPETGAYLRTFSEELERAERAEAERDWAEVERDRAQAERDRESTRAESAERRAAEAEAELLRLRERLEDLDGGE